MPARLGDHALSLPRTLLSRSGRVEAGLAALLAVAAVLARLVNIDQYTGSYPEGVRGEQLLLMSLGFRPFQDIFSDQGPWLLHVLYPGFALFGPGLVGVRAVVVLFSLLGLGGAYWLSRQLAGPVAGLATLALLAACPTYLKFSRLGVAELVALAPATLALGAAVTYVRGGRLRWLGLAGLLLAISLLIKPIGLAAGPAVLVAALRRPGRRRAVVVLAATTTLTVLVGMLLVGLSDVVREIIVFRLQSRSAEGWRPAANLARAGEELADDGLALYALGAVGLLLAAVRPALRPIAVWALGAVATVIVHTPLHAKHFTLVVVPAAVLGGVFLGVAADRARQVRGGLRALQPPAVASLLVAFYLLTMPAVLGHARFMLLTDDLRQRDPSQPWYGDAIATLRRATAPGSFVVTDHAYLAFAAGRPLPPFLNEMSATRVRGGALTDDQAIEHTRAFNSQAALFWADKLVDLRRYRAWIGREYRLAKIWAAESTARPELWLPLTGDPAIQRAALREGLQPGPTELLDGRLRAVSLALDRTVARPGEVVSATFEWEAVDGVPADDLVLLDLRAADGRRIDEEREPLLGRREILPAGWWMFWVGGLRAPAGTAPGEYHVVVALRDRVNRRLSGELLVGTVRIEPPAATWP